MDDTNTAQVKREFELTQGKAVWIYAVMAVLMLLMPPVAAIVALVFVWRYIWKSWPK